MATDARSDTITTAAGLSGTNVDGASATTRVLRLTAMLASTTPAPVAANQARDQRSTLCVMAVGTPHWPLRPSSLTVSIVPA